ncbi:MAG: type II secretion system protein GspG [Deltaproteobacteria bacterium]|nr:type II secretion system protein GspG [Deltaproteobacteria bacterium]
MNTRMATTLLVAALSFAPSQAKAQNLGSLIKGAADAIENADPKKKKEAERKKKADAERKKKAEARKKEIAEEKRKQDEERKKTQQAEAAERKRRQQVAQSVINTIRGITQHLEAYKARVGIYPSSEQGLPALTAAPAIVPTIPNDAWDRPFVYRTPGSGLAAYRICSGGEDLLPQTIDDICVDAGKIDPNTKSYMVVDVKKGEQKTLSGGVSYDQNIVGSCFDEHFNIIDDRLPGDVRSRDVDVQDIGYRYIISDEDRALNFNLLKLFNISEDTKRKSNFLAISSQVTEKIWGMSSPTAINKAPASAAYCAVEAVEGRTIDVLYQGSSALTGTELGATNIDATLGFKSLSSQLKMSYQIKAQGYTAAVPISSLQSLAEVLDAVEPGAPYFWNVVLVATKNQERLVVEQQISSNNKFRVTDGTSSSYKLAQTGSLSIEVRSTAGVAVSFDPPGACTSSPERTLHLINCELAQPAIIRVYNPALLGLGSDADVDIKVSAKVLK